MANPFHPRLYVITGAAFLRGRSLEAVVTAALEGGADCIQLREKVSSGRELLAAGQLIRRLTREQGALYIVNDRIDVAAATDADGVHLGQGDLPLAVARDLLGPDKLVGISTHNVAEAVAAEAAGADYIGLGPMFPTQTKLDTEPVVGPTGVREVRRHVQLPIVAIGGIKHEHVPAIIRGGATTVAVISAVIGADDPAAAARAFCQSIATAREGRA